MEVVKQDGNMDCGASCLLSVLRHYGGNVPIEDLREQTKTNKAGVSALSIVETARKLGCDSYGLKGELKEIDDSMLPIICHVIINKSLMHFVVLYKIDRTKKRVVLMDPAKGKRILSFSQYNLMTSNNYIYVKPIKELPNIRIKPFIKSWLKSFSKTKHSHITYIILLSLFSFILSTICGFHFSFLLNNAIAYNIKANVYKISYYILIIYCLKELLSLLKNKTICQFSYLLDEYLTKKFYCKLLLLPYMYYQNRTTGEIVARMEDLGTVKTFLTKLLSSLFTDFFVSFVFLVIIFNHNFQVFFLLLLFTLLTFLIDTINNYYLRQKMSNYYLEEDKTNATFIESIEKISTIKNLHIETSVINKFKTAYHKLLDKSYSVASGVYTNQFLKGLLNNFFYIVLYLSLSISVISNKISLSHIIIIQNMVSYFMGSLNNVLAIYNEYTPYKIAKKRIEDLFMIKTDNFCCETYFDQKLFNGTIKYHNLTYNCDSHKLFDKLDFTIKKKDKIFFYGASGSGKTTLMKMLLSYIEVPYGYVSINNIDINHHHVGLLREKISYVSQTENIFRATIEDNITLGKKIDDATLQQVCHVTALDEVIEKKPLKLKAMIEDDNYNLSGGERQRIILARVLLKNSDIYIFDEAFSQIDEQKEKLILNNIFKYLENKTIIVISHRFSNQNLYNRIVKLEKGKIYEELPK